MAQGFGLNQVLRFLLVVFHHANFLMLNKWNRLLTLTHYGEHPGRQQSADWVGIVLLSYGNVETIR